MLEQEGFRLRVEDLVDHPIFIEQLALCAAYMAQQREGERVEANELNAIEPELAVSQKKGLRKLFGEKIDMVKRIKLGKKNDPANWSAEVETTKH